MYAGLGEAASKSTSSTYDAWCGGRGMNVRFLSLAEELLSIN